MGASRPQRWSARLGPVRFAEDAIAASTWLSALHGSLTSTADHPRLMDDATPQRCPWCARKLYPGPGNGYGTLHSACPQFAATALRHPIEPAFAAALRRHFRIGDDATDARFAALLRRHYGLDDEER